MEALLYFVFWAGLVFLMMRLGCGAHVMGHGHGHGKADSESGREAFRCGNQSVSYEELARKSSQLAACLQQAGVWSGDRRPRAGLAWR